MVFNLAATPAMVNAADTALRLQAAIKNTATNEVFYFNIPILMECLMAHAPAMDVQALVAAWKSIDDSLEVSQVVNGESSACLCVRDEPHVAPTCSQISLQWT